MLIRRENKKHVQGSKKKSKIQRLLKKINQNQDQGKVLRFNHLLEKTKEAEAEAFLLKDSLAELREIGMTITARTIETTIKILENTRLLDVNTLLKEGTDEETTPTKTTMAVAGTTDHLDKTTEMITDEAAEMTEITTEIGETIPEKEDEEIKTK